MFNGRNFRTDRNVKLFVVYLICSRGEGKIEISVTL